MVVKSYNVTGSIELENTKALILREAQVHIFTFSLADQYITLFYMYLYLKLQISYTLLIDNIAFLANSTASHAWRQLI